MELTMPVGYRFVPTDEELIKHYLARKVFYKPLPAKAIKEIDASFFYDNPPDRLVEQYACDDRDWFFFVYQDDFFRGKMSKMRTVENGVGFWRSIGGDQPIYNSEGDILAFKVHFAYFSGSSPNGRRTHWKMEEYRMCIQGQEVDEWILVRMMKRSLHGSTSDG